MINIFELLKRNIKKTKRKQNKQRAVGFKWKFTKIMNSDKYRRMSYKNHIG